MTNFYQSYSFELALIRAQFGCIAADIRSAGLMTRYDKGTQPVLQEESLKHRDEHEAEATCFVSMTENLMRAVHIAFQKHKDEEDNVAVIFIAPEDDALEFPTRAQECAQICGS